MAPQRPNKNSERIIRGVIRSSVTDVPVPASAPDVPHPLGDLPPDVVEDGPVAHTQPTRKDRVGTGRPGRRKPR